MRAYVVRDCTGRVTDAFVGNGDELSLQKLEGLRARLLAIGYVLEAMGTSPVSELRDYVEALEDEESRN